MHQFFINQALHHTCTMAARSRSPLIPTASEAVDITTGPQMNRIAIAMVALFLPQTIIRGWRAMNNPAIFGACQSKYYYWGVLNQNISN
jgi:hypothetical protein